MSEPIIEYRDEFNAMDFASKYAERISRVIDEETLANVEHQLAMYGYVKVVRCRDCKFGVDGGEYCAEDCADSWDWRNVEPDGFCAWGERRGRESAEVWNQWSADDVTCSEES